MKQGNNSGAERRTAPQQRPPAQNGQTRNAQGTGGNGKKDTSRQAAEKQRRAALEAKKKKQQAEKRAALEKKKKQEREAAARKRAAERTRKHDERFELTEEEKAIRAKMRKEEKEYHSRRRRNRARVYFGRFLLFLGMFVCLLSVSVGLFYLNLIKYESGARQNFSYQVGVDAKSVSVSYDKMMRNGKLYVNMTPIVELLNLAVTGDSSELRYISSDQKEDVKFLIGSRQVFINGVEARLTAVPELDGEDLYVPYDFFETYVSGLSVSYDTEKNKVTVAQVPVEEGSSTYEDVSLVLRSDSPLTGLDEYNEFGSTSPVEFVTNLDLYEDYMNPSNRDDYLILVNEEYPLSKSYVPQTVEITDIRRDGRPLQYMCEIAEKAAHAMIMELQSNGFTDVDILLGYRSYAKQSLYFDTKVEEYMVTMSEEQATKAASAITQKPGCNPQQAGLSCIMHNLEDTSTAFSYEAAYAWLEENCWKFGFIIRYPANKTAETGMSFQPYFFTFVGRYHAMRIMERGLSMEEYIAELDEKNYFGMPYAEFREQLLSSSQGS